MDVEAGEGRWGVARESWVPAIGHRFIIADCAFAGQRVHPRTFRSHQSARLKLIKASGLSPFQD
jgi:hypothetical protein